MLNTLIEGVAKVPETNKLAADIMASLTYGVKRVLDEKLPVMKKVSGYDRKIILVWSDYIFAERDRVREIIARAPLTVKEIDSIVLIELNGVVGCVADPGGVFRNAQIYG